MRQLVNGQRIAVLIHIAVYLGAIVLKIIGSPQLEAFLPVNNRILQFGHDAFLLGAVFIQELNEFP